MNCPFCNSDLTHYRSVGLVRPAGTYQCVNCAKEHKLTQVVINVGTNSQLLDAVIRLKEYYFRIDYHANKSFLVGPMGVAKSGNIKTLETISITPAQAKQKMQTYLLFL
jgi:hypothetical protein